MGARYEEEPSDKFTLGRYDGQQFFNSNHSGCRPDEIYNLAAQSHVKVSFDVPEYTAEADAIGTLRMLEAVRILGLEKKTKIYQASTSELFGLVQEVPQKKQLRFIRVLHTELPNSMVFGLQRTIVKATECLP